MASPAVMNTPAANPLAAPMLPRHHRAARERGRRQAGGSTTNSGSRTPRGTNRCSMTMPGTPASRVIQKKGSQPMASTLKPAMGPATMRGRLKRLEKRAYCVAEKRFWVMRRSSTEKAPVPSP